MAPCVSLIIPSRDDAAALVRLLRQIDETAKTADSGCFEVIVSCATPVDADTLAVREQYPALIWLEAQPGRGGQLNAGAAQARGEWLWFVHADSALPEGWVEAFQDVARSASDVVGGSFRFALDSAAWQARVLERAVAGRVRWFGLPYGDQGIFVRRSLFQAMQGFAPIPLMEDVEFMQRLKRRGRVRHLNLSLTTSARRWEQEGWWRRSASNLVTLALYVAGVGPDRLARRYYGKTSRQEGGTVVPPEIHADQETR